MMKEIEVIKAANGLWEEVTLLLAADTTEYDSEQEIINAIIRRVIQINTLMHVLGRNELIKVRD